MDARRERIFSLLAESDALSTVRLCNVCIERYLDERRGDHGYVRRCVIWISRHD